MLDYHSPYEGKPPIELSKDAKATVTQEIQSAAGAFSLFLSVAQRNEPISADLAYGMLAHMESTLVKLCRATGIELDSVEQQECRHREIRTANLRIRELEQARGADITPADTKLSIQNLCDRLKRWWRVEGLGYVSDIRLTDYGVLIAKFSGRASSMSFYMPDCEVEDDDDENALAKWQESLRAKGFIFHQEQGDDDIVLIDCDKNRTRLAEFFKAAFPSSVIVQSTCSRTRENVFVMQDIEVYIRDLADIGQLPLVKTKQA